MSPIVLAAAALLHPALTVGAADPLTVAGAHFRVGEHVLVRASVPKGTDASRRITVGASGRFAVVFRSEHLGACDAFFVNATGDRGSRAVLKFVPQCGTEPSDPYR